MAQDLVDKRRNVATNMMIEGTRLADAIVALQELQAEFAQCGSFQQSDFDNTALKHLTPGILSAVFAGNGVVDSLVAWFTNNQTAGTSPSVVNKQNLLQMRA